MTNSSITVIKLVGELEIGRKAEIREKLSVPSGASAILLDFSEIVYADSTALAELLRFRSEAAAGSARVAIFTGSGNQRFTRLLAYAGLSDAFAVFEDRAPALNYLGEQE